MLQVVPGILDTAPCTFPTENLPGRGFESIPLDLSDCSSTVRDVLLQAWAVVLRYYVGSDMIAFGRIDDTNPSSRFAVCHGDIPASAALEALTASSNPEESQSLSLSEWISSNTFNTLVWNGANLSSEELESTSVGFLISRSLCGG